MADTCPTCKELATEVAALVGALERFNALNPFGRSGVCISCGGKAADYPKPIHYANCLFVKVVNEILPNTSDAARDILRRAQAHDDMEREVERLREALDKNADHDSICCIWVWRNDGQGHLTGYAEGPDCDCWLGAALAGKKHE